MFGLVVKPQSNGVVPSFMKRFPSIIKAGLMGELVFEITITGIPVPKKVSWENGVPFEEFDDYDMIQIHEEEQLHDEEEEELGERRRFQAETENYCSNSTS